MSDDEFQTISTPGEAQIRVMASRFLGSAFSIESVEDFERMRDVEQKKHYDATHWCWALRLGAGAELVERSSDAGEPHGTAGLPILREIQSRALTNCAVVVTRWFGGTKLGTGNLGRAYADCAGAALDAAKPVLRVIFEVLHIDCPYDDQSVVYHWAGQHGAIVEPRAAVDRASFAVKLRRAELEAFRQHVTDGSSGRISMIEAGRWIS